MKLKTFKEFISEAQITDILTKFQNNAKKFDKEYYNFLKKYKPNAVWGFDDDIEVLKYVPNSDNKTFEDYEDLIEYVEENGLPIHVVTPKNYIEVLDVMEKSSEANLDKFKELLYKGASFDKGEFAEVGLEPNTGMSIEIFKNKEGIIFSYEY